MLVVNKKYKSAMVHAKNEITRRKKENESLFDAWCEALEINKNSAEYVKFRCYMFDDKKGNIKFK